ncbi:MAG TPA: 2-phosphosulfolactate phosphatase [Candidatus Limnocylindrales bacterium]|nr:2-phosphosulfolactate phosphatase [Candidatus Limnocylindrales bacterium]
MSSPYAQQGFRVRFDWGPAGAGEIGGDARFVTVIDVLSFTTALTVAVERGIDVYPYRWRDESAVEYARTRDALLAVGRSEADGPGRVSLSPATILRAQGIRRIVLPSPNGSTIAQGLAARGATVVGVSLRNAQAAARWVANALGPNDVVAVIASGERWKPDGSLRPALEDLWGAGAFLKSLELPGSPEAEAAIAAWDRFGGRPPLADCASGRELIAYGYPEDVEVAAEVGASEAVPVLTGEAFTAAA